VAPPSARGTRSDPPRPREGKPLADDLNLTDVARKTTGMTGAQLANALNEAAIIAGRAGRDAIHREEVDEALLRQSVGSQQARRLSLKERRIVAYHEGRPRALRKLLGLDSAGDPLDRAAWPRRSASSATHVRDSYLKSRDELVDEV